MPQDQSSSAEAAAAAAGTPGAAERPAPRGGGAMPASPAQQHQQQPLESALLVKSMEAFRYSAQAYMPPGRSLTPGEANRMAAGRQAAYGISGAGLRCSWRRETRTLVMAGKGSHRLFHAFVSGSPAAACPTFLASLAPDARVHAAALQVFEDVVSSPEDPASLPATLEALLAGAAPRSILCTGACVSGTLATLAAAWAALRWPDADVRCIVFGTPRLANAVFNVAFSWLVGLSYRCVYRWDPMPDAPAGVTSTSSPLLGLLGRLHLEFTPTHSDVFLDGRGRARLEDRPILVHYQWSDHDLRAYLSTLLELAEEHNWSLSPPINQMGMCELVDPEVMAREAQLLLAAQHHPDAGIGSASGNSCASPNPDPSPFAAQSTGGSANLLPHMPHAVADAGSRVAGSCPAAPAARSSGDAESAPAHGEPAACMLAATARSTQLTASLGLPPEPAAARQGSRPSTGRGPLRSLSGSLRRMITCQPARPPAPQPPPRADGQPGPAAAANGTSDHSFTRAAAAAVPSTSGALLRAWDEIREALGQVEKVHKAMFPGGKGYVGEAAADALVERAVAQYVAGQALAHQAAGAAGNSGSSAASGAHGGSASSSVPAGGPASSGAAPTAGGAAAAAAAPAPAPAQLGWDEQEWADRDDHSDLGRQPRALQLLVARRLALPLRLSLAAYEGEAGWRRSTGITRSRLVDDRLFDAQVHVAWLPSGTAGTAVFAFRGTSNRADMLADIKVLRRQVEFLPTQLPGAKCHLGFLQQVLALTSATTPANNIGCVLAGLSGGAQPTRVVCCGHSLGGAVASIASLWAALQWPHADVRCFSFGSPKCGNSKFVRAMQTLVGMRVRVVHGGDPIPSLPPTWLVRYQHVGPACHLRGSELVLSPGSLALFPRLNLRDHQLLQYAKALAAAAQVRLERESAASPGPGPAAPPATDGCSSEVSAGPPQ